MLTNEHGRANYNSMTDIQVCDTIDILLSGRSVYSIPQSEIERIARYLSGNYRLPQEQINRCLAGRFF